MARPLSKPRPPHGAHLVALRKAAGLSQTELAELVGESQGNIAFWETGDKPPRSDVLPRMAKALGVTVEDILNVGGRPSRRTGPTGKAQRILEELSTLPRRQQEKIVEVVAAMIDQYKRSEG